MEVVEEVKEVEVTPFTETVDDEDDSDLAVDDEGCGEVNVRLSLSNPHHMVTLNTPDHVKQKKQPK